MLEIFFDSHDPSTLNQQGPDKGTQYRSAIFFVDENQRKHAELYIVQLERQNTFEKITTTIEKMTKFYPAENYHQDFVKNNPYHPYVQSVSKPRKLKFLKARSQELEILIRQKQSQAKQLMQVYQQKVKAQAEQNARGL